MARLHRGERSYVFSEKMGENIRLFTRDGKGEPRNKERGGGLSESKGPI